MRERLEVSYVTANTLVEQFEALGLLEEITGQQRFRVFRYSPYLALFEESRPIADHGAPVQVTER